MRVKFVTAIYVVVFALDLAASPVVIAADLAAKPSTSLEKGRPLTACTTNGQTCVSGCKTIPDGAQECAEYVCNGVSWNFSQYCFSPYCPPTPC
jgi:hypothetical protein